MAGLAVTSRATNLLNVASFDHVDISRSDRLWLPRILSPIAGKRLPAL
jgi:hypothetical protein